MEGKKILLTKPSMPPYEEFIKAIKPLWSTRWLTNMGRYHKEFEEKLKEYLKVKELSLLVNGHMALELAIQMMDFPEGAEIITTPFTFISTTHAIVRNRLKPVFCDVKYSDGTMDESKLEELVTKNTVAILPVHVYGNVCNVEAIQKIADKYSLKVIYDAAHAFGVKYKSQGIGSYGDASIFSFHATKVFNTIEGGAVTFSDHKYYDKLYDLKNFGIQGTELVVDIGTNAKMNEFSAIMGLCNLEHVEEAINGRKIRYEFYRSEIAKISGVRILEGNPEVKNNYAYFPIIIEDSLKNRDEIYRILKEENIFTRKYFYPLTIDQMCYITRFEHTELEYARKLSNQVLTLPFYDDLEFETIKYIVDRLKRLVEG